MLKKVLALLALSFASSAYADIVWSAGQVPDGGWPLTTAPSDLTFSESGVGTQGESGEAFASVSLAGGFMKASVVSTSATFQVGTSTSRVGLSSVIDLTGPAAVAGEVAVTMTFDGLWGGPGDNMSFMQLQSGPGFDGVGFASGDPADRGLFTYTDSAVYGPTVNSCVNCTYSISDSFVVSVTTFLPFAAGQISVQYAAQIELTTQGAFIDGTNTAVFSIALPEGFSYTSQLTFAPTVTPVPEPATFALTGLGGLALWVVARRRSRDQKRR